MPSHRLTSPFLAGALGLLLCVCAAAQTIRVAAQESSAPKFLDTPDSNAQWQGMCPDILRAIEKRNPGLRLQFDARAQPLKRIEAGMEFGTMDANCLIDNSDRRTRFTVLTTPLFSFDYHLIARNDDAIRIDSWDDVRRLGAQGRILVMSGSGAMARLARVEGLQFEEGGKSATANLQKLVLGRGRFFYYRIYEWEKEIKLAKVDGMVKILPLTMETIQFQLMFGRHVAREVIDKVQHTLHEMESDGALTQIREKWHVRLIPQLPGARTGAAQ
jgi:polar amino acid transport system substrate-binding protein